MIVSAMFWFGLSFLSRLTSSCPPRRPLDRHDLGLSWRQCRPHSSKGKFTILVTVDVVLMVQYYLQPSSMRR
jgi:hypothetical protein